MKIFFSLLLVFYLLVLWDREKEPDAPPPIRPIVTTRISNVTSESEISCLARNIYWESRGEGPIGMLAVGKVTVNRLKSGRWANSICEIVYQPWQFTWTMIPQSTGDPKHAEGETFREMAYKAIFEDFDPTNGAVYFHTKAVEPIWSKKKEMTTIIGNHIFYREKL